jgi:hypothetical protein
MKDSRLVSGNGYSMKRDSDITEGRSAAKESWFEKVVANVSAWSLFDKLRSASDDAVQSAEQLAANFADLKHEVLPGRQVALLKGIPTGLPEEIDAVVAGQHRAASNRAAWVWGTVLGRICTSETTSKLKIRAAWNLSANNEASAEAFLGEISTSLLQPGSKVFDELAAMVREIAEHPELCVFFKEDRPQALHVLKEWKRQASLIGVWTFPAFHSANRYFPPYCEQVAILEALRRVDPVRYVALLEEIGVPPLIRSSFSGLDIIDDFDAIIELLIVAPTAMEVDAAGLPKWNRSVTAALLLEIFLEHARRLGDPANEPLVDGDNGSTQRDEEAKKLVSRLAAVLLNRNDGVFLALHWLCYLVPISERPKQHTRLWTPAVPALEAVASALCAEKVGLSEFAKTFPYLFAVQEKKLEDLRQTGLADVERLPNPTGMDVLLASLWIVRSSEEKIDPRTRHDHLALFERSLIRQDSGLRVFRPEDLPTWRQWHLSYLYATDATPANAWRKTWELLAEQRRLFRHRWFIEKASQADDPSFFVATVGVSLVDWTLSPELGRNECAFPAWDAVFEGIYSSILSLLVNNERWRQLLVRLFARLPHVAPPEKKTSIVCERLFRLGGDDVLLFSCIANVIRNGVTARDVGSTLDREFEINLRSRLDGYLAWEKRPSSRHLNENLVKECHNIIDKLSS